MLINFIPLGKTSDFKKNNYSKNILNNQFIGYKHSNDVNLRPSNYFVSKNQIHFTEHIKQNVDVRNYYPSVLVSFSKKKEEIIIQSDIQSEINNILSAQGNVSVSYKGIFLKADSLIYDKLNKKISSKGNIVLIFGDQIFKLSQLEYSFISEKGYLLDVKGAINTSKFIENLYSNFSLSDINKLEKLLDLEKSEE